MARSPHGEGDRDDWFADAEPQGMLESDPPSAEDDWLVQPETIRRPGAELPWPRIAIVVGALVVILVAGLAAGGVLSGSTSSKTPPITSISVNSPTTTASTPSSTIRVLPTTTLNPGATGAQVRALQRALKALGYPVGTIDGQYGPATKTAIAAFQHAEGLTADGVFGPKTLNALINKAGP